ncbi:MAG: hypothetical protein Q4B28_05230 [bacterium]|nr:hypothetical protein [bacterium]
MITLAEKIKEGTAPHELFHATFDLVDQGRKESILEAIRKEKKLDTLNAEEFLADNFAEYFRTGRMKGEKVVGNVGRSLSSKLMGMVKEFYQRVKDWITGVSKNRSQVKKLFDEILDGEVDREMLGEMLGNKKKVATDSRAQGAPSLQPPLSRFSIQITDKNSSFYKQKFDALKTKLKINGLSAREFIDEIKLITKDK